MMRDPEFLGCGNAYAPQLLVERISHRRMQGTMRCEAFIKAHLPPSGEIYELIREDKVASLDLLSQASYGSSRYDMRASDILQRLNVRSVIHLGRRYRMLPSVPCEEDHFDAFYHSSFQWRARLSIRRGDLDIFGVFQDIRIIQS